MTKRPADGEHSLHGNDSKCINGRCTCKHVNKVENTPCCYWSWFKYAMKRGVASPPTSKSARPKPIRRNVERFRRLRLRKIQMIRISSFLTWLRYSFQPNCDSTQRKKLITKKNNYNSNDDESHQNGLWMGLLRQMRLEHLEIRFYVQFSASYWLTRDWNIDRKMSNNCILTDFEKLLYRSQSLAPANFYSYNENIFLHPKA